MAKLNFLTSLFSITDEQAMWRVQTQDDHLAFAHLVERWEAPIRRLCARLTGDPHRADDLKQETFARVFEKRKSFQPNARFSTWLWRIALNLCYDELRRINRRGESPLAVDENEGGGLGQFTTESPAPDFQLAAQEEGELVRRALLQLSDIYRVVLVLRHYQGLKLREIAEVLQIPEGTVNSRLAEGLARLTRILEPQFDQPERRPNPNQPRGAALLKRPTRSRATSEDRSSPSSQQGLQLKTVNL